jgi:hypothetical protein
VNGVSERELNVPEFVGTLGPDPRKPLSVDRPESLTTWKGLGCCSIRGYLMTIVGVGREGLTVNPSHLVDFQHAWRHLRINIILEDSIERRHITPSDLWVVDTTRESIFLVFSLTDFAHLVLNPLHQPAPETQLALDILIQYRLERQFFPKSLSKGRNGDRSRQLKTPRQLFALLPYLQIKVNCRLNSRNMRSIPKFIRVLFTFHFKFG